MAHIPVVRRSMRPEEWTDLRFGWLKRHLYSDTKEITGVEVREARQISEDEYTYYDADFRSLKRGDLYFTPDGTAFLRAEAEVPARFEGKEIWLLLKTAAEMIVKVNGKYAGGLDPNRERMLLTPFLDGNRASIEITGYNRSKPDDERNPAAMSMRGCRQIFSGVYFAIVDQPVQELLYDIGLLLDISRGQLIIEDYRALVGRGVDSALNLIDFDDVRDEDVLAARESIQKNVFDNDDYRGSGNVALVAHSHLDLAYYWRRIHSVQKNLRTVLIQMRLMDRYPDFRYAHTQAYTYETVEKYYPEVFSELRQKIAEGRFEPVGAMYVEPDCNIPCAESLVRQCLYGQTYFRQKFGLTVDNCWLPDVFGNSWILPQILKKSCVDYFVSNKMSTWNDTNRFPHTNFPCKGINCSAVYTCVPPTQFITCNMPSQIQENWEAYQDKNRGGQTLSMFGYGDGGSGVTEEMIELMHRFGKVSAMPKTEHTTAREFLHKNFDGNTDLATWDGELYLEMHRGTFTTKSKLKRGNRMLENKFREAELRCVLRRLNGEQYPAEKIRGLYKKLLVNQFHDIIPGSHIAPVYRDAMADYREIGAELDSLLAERSPNYFNSLNFTRKQTAFVADDAGGDSREGIRGFWTVPVMKALSSAPLSPAEGDASWLRQEADGMAETPFYRIRFAPDGSILSLYDRQLCREWVKGDFNKLRIYADCPGHYDAWDILPNYRGHQIPVQVRERLRFVKCGPEAAEFCAVLATEKSRWELTIRLFRSSRGIEVESRVDWHELHKLAKAEFSPELLARELVCDTSAGFIRREMNRNTTWQQARFEVCHHKWFDLSETGAGIAVINEGKYGVGIEPESVGLSLLRATERPDPSAESGEHRFSYLILPHEGDAVQGGVNRAALEYNTPLLPGNESFPFDFSPLFLQAAKLSEDGKRAVVRLSEQDGRRGQLRLPRRAQLLNLLEDVQGEDDCISYRPFEIITLGFPL